MQHRIHTLKNGLRIVFVQLNESPSATVMIMSGTGSRYESAEENGLAHFLEHMFFKGTKKRPKAKDISEELDGIGSQYNAFTAKDRTAYYAKVSRRHLDTALSVITDIFLNSALPSREITKERGAIIQEIDMYEDMPIRTVDTVFDALLFGKDHSLGRTILGPKDNIRAFTKKHFTDYLKRNYTPENTVVCVAGSFDEKKVLKDLTRLFSGLTKRPAPHFERVSAIEKGPRVAIKHKKTDQTQLMLGVPAYPYGHKDEYALEVLAMLLGGGMSSRLFTEVREKRGLAYYVRGWTDKYPDVGMFLVQAGVEHGKLQTALSTMLGEFRKLTRVGVGAKELERVKSYIEGTLELDLETTDHLAENACTSLLTVGRIRTPEEIVKGVRRVSALDIMRVAKDMFRREKLYLAIIGPHESESALKRLLAV